MVQAVKVFLAPEEIEPLNLTDIETENDTPVDNFFTGELRRLLVEVLYGAWAKKIYPRKFLAGADIGVFYAEGQPPLVPDVFLSLDVEIERDFYDKLVWVCAYGKGCMRASRIVGCGGAIAKGGFSPLAQKSPIALRRSYAQWVSIPNWIKFYSQSRNFN